jgi:DNA helicase-4
VTDARSDWKGNGWTVSVGDHGLVVVNHGKPTTVTAREADALTLSRSWFRWELHLDGRSLTRLGGISRRDIKNLQQSVERLALSIEITAAVQWRRSATALLSHALTEQRWIAREPVDDLIRTRPQPGLIARIRRAGLEHLLNDDERAALVSLDENLTANTARANDEILAAELRDRRDFFDRIERSPLTNEQAAAVVCFDNRVHVVAAAGSGG